MTTIIYISFFQLPKHFVYNSYSDMTMEANIMYPPYCKPGRGAQDKTLISLTILFEVTAKARSELCYARGQYTTATTTLFELPFQLFPK